MIKLQDLVNKKYHEKIGFPKNVVLPSGKINLKYGPHSRKEALEDKYGNIILPNSIDLNSAYIYEIVVNPLNDIVKAACRTSYDDKRDLILVISFPDHFVITVWSNYKSDVHHTLNKSNYSVPEN